jgi:predicted PurR-regulated permease PerM
MIRNIGRYILRNQVILALLIIATGWLVLQTLTIWAVLFTAYIIMTGFMPLVNWLIARKIPKMFAIALPYLITLILIVLLIIPTLPLFIDQIHSLLNNFPDYMNKTAKLLNLKVSDNQFQTFLTSQLNSIGENIVAVTGQIFGAFFAILTLFVISFYMLIDHERIKRNITELFPRRYQSYIHTVIVEAEQKLGAWLRGQLVLSLVIGLCTWIALSLVGMKYALPLSLIAGVGEAVPTVGPIISAIPAIIIALNISPTMAGIVALIYILIQFAENHLIVPKVMQRAIGLHPLFTILTILIGGQLMGVLGALLAIPLVAFCSVFITNLEKSS